MADIAAEDQAKIVFYLGYPAKVIVKSSTHFNGIIADRFLDLEQTTVDQVTALLALIESTRTKLDDTRDDAQVTSVGEINLDPAYVDKYIAKNYRRYINEISSLLDIPIRKSNFGGTSVKVTT